MARIIKPQFGARQHRPSAQWQHGDPPQRARRIDWQVVSLVAIVFVASFVWLLPALEEQGGILDGVLKGREDSPRRVAWSSPIQVVDGDTVRRGGKTYRLVGFNTPEAGRLAHCAHERTLASKAAARLRVLVDGSETELTRVPCACPPGTEGSSECNYGRLCARLKADGRDVGQILIAEGLAEPYTCGTSSCPPRRDWCAG